MSGYSDCSCRDCFDVSFTSDGGWTLCQDCLDAGCVPWRVDTQEPSWMYDCGRADYEHHCEYGCGY